jgi:hypothetical protein
MFLNCGAKLGPYEILASDAQLFINPLDLERALSSLAVRHVAAAKGAGLWAGRRNG